MLCSYQIIRPKFAVISKSALADLRQNNNVLIFFAKLRHQICRKIFLVYINFKSTNHLFWLASAGVLFLVFCCNDKPDHKQLGVFNSITCCYDNSLILTKEIVITGILFRFHISLKSKQSMLTKRVLMFIKLCNINNLAMSFDVICKIFSMVSDLTYIFDVRQIL